MRILIVAGLFACCLTPAVAQDQRLDGSFRWRLAAVTVEKLHGEQSKRTPITLPFRQFYSEGACQQARNDLRSALDNSLARHVSIAAICVQEL